MATVDNPPEGKTPTPSTYPNPMANNVNFHPIGWNQGQGVVWKQDDPIGPGPGNGTQVTHS